MKFIQLCCFFLLLFISLWVTAQNEACNGSIRYADWENLTASDVPVLYCYNDFESLPGTPIVNPIEGIFIPFFVNTEAVLGNDNATYTGSTLSTSHGAIYDFVASGRTNNGEATKYIHFLNLSSDDLLAASIILSFTDSSGNCEHELAINVVQDLPNTIEEVCPAQTTDCNFTFRIEYIDWSVFLFEETPTAYCAEELSSVYPEANGTFEGGLTDATKPGVYIPFSIRSNAPESFYENSTLSISNGAIYRSSEPPQLNDGSGSPNIYFMYLTDSNLSTETISLTFTDSTNVCMAEKKINVADVLGEVNPSTQCVPQNCGNTMCDGIESYANCPDDCDCTGNIQFINWPSFTDADVPQVYCAESLSIDSIGFFGGNTDRMNPGFYVPFRIDTEALPNEDGLFEESALSTSAGLIYNATNPPSLNTDSIARAGVHFLYLTQTQLDENNSIQLRFIDSYEKCRHAASINVNNQLPETVPVCDCSGNISFVDWDEKLTIELPKTYCAEELGDYENWQSNVDTPTVFIPFIVQTGATIGMDSITYVGSKLSVSAGSLYNSTIPPSPSNGEARVFIHLLSLSAVDLENESITISFSDSTGTCIHETLINVAEDLPDAQPEICLEAECGNSICEAVESFADCPDDCECQGIIRFLELEEWPNLVSDTMPNAYCVEQLVPPGVNVETDAQNPGVYIPFTIQSQAEIDSNEVYINSKINTNVGAIYDVQIPPTENDGFARTVHYLYLSVSAIEAGGDVIDLTFSSENSVCVHAASINLTEDFPDLDPVMQCLEYVCGDGVCDAAETYSECAEDCPCLGAIEFVDWATLTTTSEPMSYCYEAIAEGPNPIDANNPGIFIPFRINTNAALGEDSVYTNSNLLAAVGTIYDNVELPVANNGMGSIYAHILYISADDWERNDSTNIRFTDESGDCAHEITIRFAADLIDNPIPSDCYMVDVDDYINLTSALQLYPNPASDILTVNFTKSTFAPEKITVYNMFGQSVRELNPKELLPNASYNLNIESLSKGTYFIAAFSNKGQVVAERFIKE